MKNKTHCLIAGVAVGVIAALAVKARRSRTPLQTVAQVDLRRYLGHWYEIARYPNRFEKKCHRDVTAEYSLRSDGTIEVVNSCSRRNGEIKRLHGIARIVDRAANAKLKVVFFWPFYGDYWILDLGEAPDGPAAPYLYSVVSEPSRRYLWILSRSPEIPEPLYQQILARVASQGFVPSALLRTHQSAGSVGSST